MDIFKYQEHQQVLAQDRESISVVGVVIQNIDMVVASTEKIAELIDDSYANKYTGERYWRVTEIAKNANGDTIAIKVRIQSDNPGFVNNDIYNWVVS